MSECDDIVTCERYFIAFRDRWIRTIKNKDQNSFALELKFRSWLLDISEWADAEWVKKLSSGTMLRFFWEGQMCVYLGMKNWYGQSNLAFNYQWRFVSGILSKLKALEHSSEERQILSMMCRPVRKQWDNDMFLRAYQNDLWIRPVRKLDRLLPRKIRLSKRCPIFIIGFYRFDLCYNVDSCESASNTSKLRYDPGDLVILIWRDPVILLVSVDVFSVLELPITYPARIFMLHRRGSSVPPQRSELPPASLQGDLHGFSTFGDTSSFLSYQTIS
jgi:hypothetical protein